MGYELKTGKFPSSNGACDIAWYHFRPLGVAVRSILVVCHGKSEHILRYKMLAEYLCNEGIAVFGCDHLGHGDSVEEGKVEYGHFGNSEKNLDGLVENQKLLIDLIRKRYPHLPLVMFGHSMGSFVVRKFMICYPAAIDAAILCGTGTADKKLNVGIGIFKLLSMICGKKRKLQKVDDMMFQGYNDHFPGEEDMAWLTKDAAMRREYYEDPKGNFIFSLGANLCMLNTLKEVGSEQWYLDVPKGLPILLISGMDDPVGGFGEGTREIYENLLDAEVCSVEMKLYENDRHNILHELDKETVFADILSYMEKISDGVYAARTFSGYNGGLV